MKKYIKTKDGRIIDLQKFIEEEKKSPYYTDYEFEEIKNEEDYCSIHWTAIEIKENSQEDQIGRRCEFGAIVDSQFIKQSDNLEELCDFIFVKDEYGDYRLYDLKDWKNTDKEYLKESWINGWLKELYYCIKTDKGLIYIANMNNKGELELI